MRLFIFEDGRMVQAPHDITDVDLECIGDGILQIIETDGSQFYDVGPDRVRKPVAMGTVAQDDGGDYTAPRDSIYGPPDNS
jgi:hypothetical protein